MTRARSAGEEEWATLRDELSRKVLSVLSDRVDSFERGEISRRQLRLVVDSLYDTVSGLVGFDVTDLIYAVRKDLKL